MAARVRSQREAVAWRDSQRVGIRSGSYVQPDRVTLAPYPAEWLPSIRSSVRASTWSSYAGHARVHIIPRLGSKPLQSLSVEDVDSLYADLLASGLSAATVRRVHATLRHVLRDARRRGRVVRNVAEDATLPQAAKPKLNVWTADEARTFLGHVEQRDPMWYSIFALILSSGMRRGEAIGLRWEDVNLDAGSISVTRSIIQVDGAVVVSEPKTPSGWRRIALDPTTIGVLRRHRARQAERRLAAGELWQETDLVFSRADGTALRPDHVSRTFSSFAEKSGVPLIRLHDLRHTAATLMLLAGVPAKIASSRLGHSNIAVTLDIYTTVLPKLDEDAAASTASLIYGSG